MKFFIYFFWFLLAMPLASTAQGLATSASGSPLQDLLTNIVVFSSNVLIPFILAIGFVVFVWGMFQYFIAGGANDEAKDKGKSLMLYATAGFVLIIIFWGVINLLTQSTGLAGKTVNNIPSAPKATNP